MYSSCTEQKHSPVEDSSSLSSADEKLKLHLHHHQSQHQDCQHHRQEREVQLTAPFIRLALLLKVLFSYLLAVHISSLSRLFELKKKKNIMATASVASLYRDVIPKVILNSKSSSLPSTPATLLPSISISLESSNDENSLSAAESIDIDNITDNEFKSNHMRLSFRKTALKRNLNCEDDDGSDETAAKSPSVMFSKSQPFPASHYHQKGEPALPEQFSKLSSLQKRNEFNLDLTDISCKTEREDMDQDNQFSQTTNDISIIDSKECHSNDLLYISPKQLGKVIHAGSVDFILLDCRSFMKFNSNHISGAVNICCTNNTIKKRFRDGKIGMVDLISGVEEKLKFQDIFSKSDSLFVLYDDDTNEVDQLTACSSLKIVYDKLLSHIKRVKYLKGGMKEFLISQSHQCTDPVTNELQPLLFSPTSPYVDTAIDTAVMTEILPFLLLGNEKDASDIERLRSNNITHILNVTAGIPMFCENAHDITGLRLSASDSGSQNIKQYFDEAIQFIESARQNNGRVLIHCQAGVSRSPTITMAYLMAKFSWPYMQAFNEVKSKRSIVSPNINFLGQLLEFEGRAKCYFSKE